MIDYFKSKKSNDFNSNKKFWEFYSTHIRVRSDKTSNKPITTIRHHNNTSSQSDQISNIFNNFFCSASSNSTKNK